MKKTILILGAGRMVHAIAHDLHQDFSLTIADINPESLLFFAEKFGVKTMLLNVADEVALTNAIHPFDLIIGAVPGNFGFEMLKTVVKAGKKIVDISFMPENALELDALAKQNNALALVDFGVAPGLSNLLLGHHASHIKVSHFVCQVGGLPVAKTWPYQYKAPFSPIDVIEEYTRPARIMRNGNLETVAALSDAQIESFEGVGELESFVTDGLRSLLFTVDVPNMVEKTLRYPGHRELMEIYRESGFFSKEEIVVNGQKVRPLDVTAALLLPKWQLHKNVPEFTVMTIDILGEENGQNVKYSYFLLDYFDAETGLSSMARTTGFTCATAARLVLENQFAGVGIFPPEHIGSQQNAFSFILANLQKHGIQFKVTKTTR